MEKECPECGAMNEVDDEKCHELICCWNCGNDYEYDPKE